MIKHIFDIYEDLCIIYLQYLDYESIINFLSTCKFFYSKYKKEKFREICHISYLSTSKFARLKRTIYSCSYKKHVLVDINSTKLKFLIPSKLISETSYSIKDSILCSCLRKYTRFDLLPMQTVKSLELQSEECLRLTFLKETKFNSTLKSLIMYCEIHDKIKLNCIMISNTKMYFYIMNPPKEFIDYLIKYVLNCKNINFTIQNN